MEVATVKLHLRPPKNALLQRKRKRKGVAAHSHPVKDTAANGNRGSVGTEETHSKSLSYASSSERSQVSGDGR